MPSRIGCWGSGGSAGNGGAGDEGGGNRGSGGGNDGGGPRAPPRACTWRPTTTATRARAPRAVGADVVGRETAEHHRPIVRLVVGPALHEQAAVGVGHVAPIAAIPAEHAAVGATADEQHPLHARVVDEASVILEGDIGTVAERRRLAGRLPGGAQLGAAIVLARVRLLEDLDVVLGGGLVDEPHEGLSRAVGEGRGQRERVRDLVVIAIAARAVVGD